MTSISPGNDSDANLPAAPDARGEHNPPGSPSVLLPAAFFAWLAVVGILAFAKQPAIALVVIFAGILIPWFAILAVAWLVPPPRPLAETRLLAQRLIWVVRAGWAAVVFGGSAIVSTTIALQVEANASDPDVWNDVLSYVLKTVVFPVLMVAAFLASSTLPFQLGRTEQSDRDRAVRTLVKPLAQQGVPTIWLERFIIDATAPLAAFFLCYLGPAMLLAASHIAWAYVDPSGTTP